MLSSTGRRSASRWLALAAFALLLWVAREVLSPFVVGGILAYILSPLVDELAVRARIPRNWAALLVVVALVSLLALGGSLLGARLIAEVRALGVESPRIAETIALRLTGGATVDVLGQPVSAQDLAERMNAAVAEALGNPSGALHAARLALGIGLNILLALLALVYLLLDGHRLHAFLLRFVPAEHSERVERVTAEIHRVLGRYLQGQLLLVVLVSAFTFFALEWLFHLRYALPIALATGVLELIPLIGPVMAAAIACAVGFVQGGVREAGALALLYLIIRQAEDQLVMPLVVGRAVHVHPLVTIFAVVTGERVAGVLGMLLAVPFAAAAKVVLDHAYPPPRPKEEAAGRAMSGRTPMTGATARPPADGGATRPAPRRSP